MPTASNRMSVASADFLDKEALAADAALAAVADNCRFDERASAARWRRLEEILLRLSGNPGAIGWPAWGDAVKLHLDQYHNVTSLSVPDAFLEINREAWLPAAAPNQDVVRLEVLTRAWNPRVQNPEELGALLRRFDSGKDEDARGAVEMFFVAWNQRRDNRPAFATPYDQVKVETESNDWPHLLRDRLALGHYGCPDG